MEPIGTFLMTALGYILKSAAQSKAAQNVKEELLGRFWGWIRPRIVTDIPEVEEMGNAAETEAKVHQRLVELIKDEEFFNELAKRVTDLQNASIKEKNIVGKDIKRVRRIKIGDAEYSPTDDFDRKNIIEGGIEDAEEFTLGDGHS